jgi:hypothetical protein
MHTAKVAAPWGLLQSARVLGLMGIVALKDLLCSVVLKVSGGSSGRQECPEYNGKELLEL